MTPDQALDSCPFCGAARKPRSGFCWFECGTMTAPADNNRRDQTPTCATAERSRLTRERDEARAEALVHLGNKLQAEDERDAALARIKRLEKAGDALDSTVEQIGIVDFEDIEAANELDIEANKSRDRWRKAKEATP